MSIENHLAQSISVKKQLIDDESFKKAVRQAADYCIETLTNNGKVLLCGNGGSAADAQHIAAELSGRFRYDRPPLYAEALHVNSSYMTAVANDYGFDVVYSRMLEACGKPKDVLIALSTSGNSENIIKAAKQAKKQEMYVVAMTGAGGGKMAEICDVLIQVPSTVTAFIQESHITIGHILCEIIESRIFPKK